MENIKTDFRTQANNINQPIKQEQPAADIKVQNEAIKTNNEVLVPSGLKTPIDTGNGEMSDGTTLPPTTPPTSPASVPTPTQTDEQKALQEKQKLLDEQQKQLTTTELERKKAELASQGQSYLGDLQKNKEAQVSIEEQAKAQQDAYDRERLAREQNILERKNKLLQDQGQRETAKLQAEAEQKRINDEEAIKEAQIANNVAEIQSARAFHRLGAFFSTASIVQAQSISERGARAIASLKIESNKNQLEIQSKIADLQATLNDKVNDNIEKYQELMATIDDEAKKRINTLALNKMKTSEEILKETKSVKDKYIADVRDLERQFKADQLTLADETIKTATQIRAAQEAEKAKVEEQLTQSMATGKILSLTSSEKAQLEKQLGYAPGYIDTKIEEGITKGIRGELDKLVGEAYYPSNMSDLVKEVSDEMKHGRTYASALAIVMDREKARNPDVSKAIQAKQNKIDIDWYKAETERMKATGELGIKSAEFEQTYGTSLNGNNYNSPSYIGTGGDLTDEVNKYKGTSTNVGIYTNNPSNIMGDTPAQQEYAKKLGAVGFYKSINGRTYAVFPDAKTGDDALYSDLNTKINGGSTWATKNTTLADFAKGWTNGPSGAPNPGATRNMIKYLKSKGIDVNENTKIGDIDIRELGNATKFNEGTLGKSTNVTYSDGQQKTEVTPDDNKTTLTNAFNSMTRSELLSWAGKNSIKFEDDKNINVLRNNMIGAIEQNKKEQSKEANDNAMKKLEDINSGTKYSNEAYNEIAFNTVDDNTKKLLTTLGVFNSDGTINNNAQSMGRIDYKSMSLLDNNTQKVVRFLQRIGQVVILGKDMPTSDAKLTSNEQAQLKNNLKTMIDGIENATITNVENEKMIRERYIAPMLKGIGINYDKEKDEYYIKALGEDIILK